MRRPGAWSRGSRRSTLPGHYLGHPARTWLLALPGYGYGTATIGDGLPLATSWPPGARFRGQVLLSGAEGGASWGVVDAFEGSQACLELMAPRTPDEACVGMAPPAEPDAAAFIGAGSAWVLLEGPPGASAHVDAGAERVVPQCDGVASGSAGTPVDVDTPPAAGPGDIGLCVVRLPGETGSATIIVVVDGNVLGAPYSVDWSPAGVELRTSPF